MQPTLPGKDQTSQSDIYQVGTSITFSCREGYELIGESLLVCLENETWSNTYPRCVRKLKLIFHCTFLLSRWERLRRTFCVGNISKKNSTIGILSKIKTF